MFRPLVLSLLLLWSPWLVFGQVGTEVETPESTCDCSPPCHSSEVDLECKQGRTVPRGDCPCCKVCLRQEGETCGDENSPCDTKMGLTCSSKGICEGNTKCKIDSDCESHLFCVRETCTDPCPLIQPCLGTLKGGVCVTRDHQFQCECPKGTITNHETKTCVGVEENPSNPTPVLPISNTGCKVKGQLKRIGESFYTPDCTQKCVCEQDGTVVCVPISCPNGLFPSGTSKDQRFCIEIRNTPFSDECCVVLACSNNFLQSVHSPSSKNDQISLMKKAPRSLTGRKVSSDGEELISEHDYQRRLEELEAILNGNSSFGTEDPFKDNIDIPNPSELAENQEAKVDKQTTTMEELLEPPSKKTNLKKTKKENDIKEEIGMKMKEDLKKDEEGKLKKQIHLQGLEAKPEKEKKMSDKTNMEEKVQFLSDATKREAVDVNDQMEKVVESLDKQEHELGGDIETNKKLTGEMGEDMKIKNETEEELKMENESKSEAGMKDEMETEMKMNDEVKPEMRMKDELEPEMEMKDEMKSEIKMTNETKSETKMEHEMGADMKIKDGMDAEMKIRNETEDVEIEHKPEGKMMDELNVNDGFHIVDSSNIEGFMKKKEGRKIDGEMHKLKMINETSVKDETKMKDDASITNPKDIKNEVKTKDKFTDHIKTLFETQTSDEIKSEEMKTKAMPGTTEESISFTTFLLQNPDATVPSPDARATSSPPTLDMTTQISTEIPLFIFTTQNDVETSSHPNETMGLSNATSTSTSTSYSSYSSIHSTSEKGMEDFNLEAITAPKEVPSTVLLTTMSSSEGGEDSLHKDGMIMEVAEDGKPLHNVSFLSEMTNNEAFREGKKTDEENMKAIQFPDKETKATLMQLDKIATKPGMLQIKSSTHNSTTLLLPTSSGGILHYKESRSDIEAMKLSVPAGQEEVTVTGLNPDTRYTFKWAASGAEASKGKIEAKTEDGCRHNSLSYAIGATWHEGCQTTCSCQKAGISDCRARCLFVAGDVQDEQCEEVPSPTDPDCCVSYNCKKKDNSVLDAPSRANLQESNPPAEPKLIVTARRHNSVTVAWDDFRAGNPDRGYVTEYREVPEVEISAEIPWMKKETLRGQPPPTMTIGSLKPNTLYEVRVGIYSQAEERRLTAATETIRVRTEPGCVYGNTSFPVGEFFQGCEERCSCSKDGSVKCAGRCTIPYFRKGSFANDPLCTEEQEEGDDCCVLVMCAHGSGNNAGELDHCADTVCGNNAECVSWPTVLEPSEHPDLSHIGSCRCKEGFSGDPTDPDVGCLPDPKIVDESNACVFKLTSYSPGDVFYDGCSYRCTCTSQKEIECQPRCSYSIHEVEEDSNNSCTFQPDPNDECCKIRVCNSTADGDLTAVQSPGLDFDGCMYRNKTYAKNETFSFGCDSKCLCMGFGDVSCYPRCPPVKDIPKKEGMLCQTLVDPEDECCSVTVCDNSATDVMKENVTDVMLLKEISINETSMNETMNEFMNKTSMETMEGMMNGTMDKMMNETMDKMMNETMDKMMNETMSDSMNGTMDKMMNETMLTSMNETMDEMSNETTTEMIMLLTEDDMVNKTTMQENTMEKDSMNKTINNSMDSILMENETAEQDMNTSESSAKNMTSLEDAEENVFNVTTMEKSLERGTTMNSTDDMMLMNETTESTMSLEDDMMIKHNNETEDDAMMLDDESLTNLTNSNNETESRNTTEDMMMKDEMDEFLLGRSLGEENDTTAHNEFFEEERISDREGMLNETSFLEKKPRFEDKKPSLEIIKIAPKDSSTVMVTVKVQPEVLHQLLSSGSEYMVASYSPDGKTWMNHTVPVRDMDVENMYDISFMVSDLENYDSYDFQVYYQTMVSPILKVNLESSVIVGDDPTIAAHEAMCSFKGELYNVGEYFYDGCVHYCQCTVDATVHCGEIKCPERSGLDLVDPGCLEWQDDPNYVATPPRCCGQKPQCALHVDHLACHQDHQTFQHLDFLPQEIVGCDKQCQCFRGTIECENLCNPVQAVPPHDLPCDLNETILITSSSYPCCREWQCSNESFTGFFPGHPPVPAIHLGYPPIAPPPDLNLIDVQEVTGTSAKIIFEIAKIFIGLPGGIYLRYTSDAEAQPNPLEWRSEVIHEDGILMEKMLWEYVKTGLQPNTNYTMQLALFTHLKRSESVSSIFMVSTMMESTTPLPRLDLDAELSVSEIRNTSAKISWKRFNDHELQYIDGIRIRFWPGNKKFPLEGPMLHREADSMILRDLLPDNNYTVDLFFIPHPGLTSTISNTKNITFKTLPKPKDKYGFTITIEAGETTKDGVKILYSGVTEPEGKYVNVYRAVYITDGDSQDSQKFKVPKNQKEGFITITDLKPGAQYEIWLEAYLTNGNKKKSNVITIQTKPGELPTPEKSEIAESSQLETKEAGSYYSAFVVVVILVVLACLIIFGLIFVLFRRQNHAKAHINSSKSNSAYDNPSYKTSENQNYAMELNGLKTTPNGASRAEEP